MPETKDPLCAILLGAAPSPEAARQYVDWTKNCPYVSTLAVEGSLVVTVYVLPQSKRFWVEIPAHEPHLLGMQSVKLLFPEQHRAESPWSRGEVQPVLPLAPCGSDCASCPQYQQRCSGCPATVYALDEPA